MNNDSQTRRWMDRHNIKIVDTSRRVHKYTPNLKYFSSTDDYNFIDSMVTRESETLVVLEIPESNLDRIYDFEQQVFNHASNYGHFNLFQAMLEQKEKEKYLCNKYPAVENAYKNYSLILKLAESGEL